MLGPPKFDLSTVGYVQEEYFVSGDATSYTSDEPLSEDGEWNVTPDATAPYTTRIVVRRPADAADFNGTVIIEWFNVSGGLDADPRLDLHPRRDRAVRRRVGRRVGAEGRHRGRRQLARRAARPQERGPGAVRTAEHPGDDYSYDIFSQAGAAVWFAHEKILGELRPDVVLAMGESQSAFRLTTYMNAVAPLNDVFDGYLVHSRGRLGCAARRRCAAADRRCPSRRSSRTDLEVPVLVFSSETDLTNDCSGTCVHVSPTASTSPGWEVAGTAHADAYSLGIGDNDDGSLAVRHRAVRRDVTPPQSVYFGVISCGSPIN